MATYEEVKIAFKAYKITIERAELAVLDIEKNGKTPDRIKECEAAFKAKKIEQEKYEFVLNDFEK